MNSMKLFAIALSMGLSGAQASSTVWLPVSDVFAPRGFDSNDNTQIVISGYLPDLCHKAPRARAVIQGSVIYVVVSATLDTSSGICPEMLVPYLEVVSLNTIHEGNYSIVVNRDSSYEKKSFIQVAPAPVMTRDNFIYANIEYVQKTPGSRKVVLRGYNPSSCLVFDRVVFVSNGRDTFSILPIMKQVSSVCAMKLVPFEIETAVPMNLAAPQVLLHVRVMDGRSVNTVFENRPSE